MAGQLRGARGGGKGLVIEKKNILLKVFFSKKIFNQDEGMIEYAVGNREMGFWQGKKIEVSGSWYCQIQTT